MKRTLGIACLVMLAMLLIAGARQGQAPPIPTVVSRVAVLYIESMDPPPVYAKWYADAERCTGLKGDYAKVRWYKTPHPWSDEPKDTTWAMWQPEHRITMNLDDKFDSTVVMHEAIHDILHYQKVWDEKNPHPSAFFGVGRCVFIHYHHN